MRMIDADELCVRLREAGGLDGEPGSWEDGFDCGINAAIREVDTLNTVDSVKSGEWVNRRDGIPCCSECGMIPVFDCAQDDYEHSKFCPECGAKMEEMENE